MKYYEDYKKHFLNIKRKKQVLVNCPFHNDKVPSLSINLENGLFKCFACNESGNYKQFIQRLNNEPVVIKNKKTYLPTIKLSLEEYSKRKKLPLKYLKDIWKLKDYENGVLFPYLDEQGNVFKEKIHYGNKKFKYLHNDKPLCLYGLQNIKGIKEKEYVILVEGESTPKAFNLLHKLTSVDLTN